MPDLILHTLDWVPDFPRGFVRDLRLRWALEEAGPQRFRRPPPDTSPSPFILAQILQAGGSSSAKKLPSAAHSHRS